MKTGKHEPKWARRPGKHTTDGQIVWTNMNATKNDLRAYQAQVEPSHVYGRKALAKVIYDANLKVLTSGQLFLIEDRIQLAFLHGVMAAQGVEDIEP